jgi:hypothetical protein
LNHKPGIVHDRVGVGQRFTVHTVPQHPRAQAGQAHLLRVARPATAAQNPPLYECGLVKIKVTLSMEDLVSAHDSDSPGVLAKVNSHP